MFATQDRDLLLPRDPENMRRAWTVCEDFSLDLVCGGEPLDRPRDNDLAKRVIATRALVRATDHAGLDVDFTLIMTGFQFDRVWKGRRIFHVEAVERAVSVSPELLSRRTVLARPVCVGSSAEPLDAIVIVGSADDAEWS
jgi:hypothetical protein